MKWVITGGCGFIGLNLIKDLCKDKKNKIRVIDNFSQGNDNDLKSVSHFTAFNRSENSIFSNDVQLIKGDVIDTQLAIDLTRDADVIVNLAANTGVQPSIESPIKDCEINISGTLNYLEAAKINNVKKFIQASSSAAVGQKIPPINENMPAAPLSPYGASKLSGEAYCSAYYHSFGINTVALRFGNVYGPMSKHKKSVISKFISNIIKGNELEVYGNGAQTRDFIYVSDLISSIILSANNNDIGGEVFQIANNTEVEINEIIQILRKVSNNEIKVNYCEERIGDIRKIYSDTSKARKILNWSPKFSMREGLVETFRYFNNELIR